MLKRIVIYGGAGGIGSATARLLRLRGCELHLVGRTEPELAALSSELQAGYTLGDVCDETLFSQVSKMQLPFITRIDAAQTEQSISRLVQNHVISLLDHYETKNNQ